MEEKSLINIDLAKRIIDALKSSFDSHDFIMALVLSDTITYLGIVRQSHSIISANQKIGAFLLNNSKKLGISKQGEIESENILGKTNPCAFWIKNTNKK